MTATYLSLIRRCVQRGPQFRGTKSTAVAALITIGLVVGTALGPGVTHTSVEASVVRSASAQASGPVKAFRYPRELASEIEKKVLAPSEPSDPMGWQGSPGGTAYTFKGTPGARSEYDNGSLEVYRVDEYEAIAQDAIDVFTHLRQVSADHPELRLIFPMSLTNLEAISGPYGPPPVGANRLRAAAMEYAVRFEYIETAEISGYRYLFAGTQNPCAGNGASARYVYNGLTTDGRWFVNLTYPVTVKRPFGNFKGDWNNPDACDRHLADLATYMETVSESELDPPPSSLDSIIQTLEFD